ncbi:MAG: PEP-CTERM sorting domain-containing protein [Opitutaceae bacterium]|nr:PEP-CTERM sorting domain-containing protein [Opitutaceae bacterium]
MKSGFLPLLFCTLFATAHAQFVLVETGGTFRSDATNLAAASNGGIAIGQDELGYGIHFISTINDGVYGNDSSWIGLADYTTSWVGVILPTPSTIASFAFGRDNTGVQITRAFGPAWIPHVIQYTTDAVTDQASANSATWLTTGSMNYAVDPPPSPELRHLYNLTSPLTGVTAFRIVTSSGIDWGTAIDEIELYSTSAIPEPSTYAVLAGLAALGLAAWRRRRA